MFPKERFEEHSLCKHFSFFFIRYISLKSGFFSLKSLPEFIAHILFIPLRG